MKLNLGCGSSKLEGYVNVDINSEVKPDLVADITLPLPFEVNSIESVVLSHTIEHIPRSRHRAFLEYILTLLKPGGEIFLSFPNFRVCAKFYLENYQGLSSYWEQTIMGRGTELHDTHVCAMLPEQLLVMLVQVGFVNIRASQEVKNPHNTLVFAEKPIPLGD